MFRRATNGPFGHGVVARRSSVAGQLSSQPPRQDVEQAVGLHFSKRRKICALRPGKVLRVCGPSSGVRGEKRRSTPHLTTSILFFSCATYK